VLLPGESMPRRNGRCSVATARIRLRLLRIRRFRLRP